MNNKGFTLIELVTILMLLALLTTMTYYEVSKAVKFAEENTAKESAIMVMEAADHYYADLGYVNFPSNGINIKKLDIKSTGFQYGYVRLGKTGYVVYNLYDGVYCVNGVRENLILTKGDCYTGEGGNYKYYQSRGYGITKPEQGLDKIPTIYSSYLRYKVFANNTLDNPQACIMDLGRQLCLSYSELDKELKIKSFFFFDEDEWATIGAGYWLKPANGVSKEELLNVFQLLENEEVEDISVTDYLEMYCDFSNQNYPQCTKVTDDGSLLIGYDKSTGALLTTHRIGKTSFSCAISNNAVNCQ